MVGSAEDFPQAEEMANTIAIIKAKRGNGTVGYVQARCRQVVFQKYA